jgi:hypothetical protein
MDAAAATTEPAVQSDAEPLPTTPPTDHADADLLRGLGALADLIANASETLNQCLLTIEGKLNAAAVAKEEWIPIKTARSAVEHVPVPGEDQASQERVFGGVPVTIMKFGALAAQPERMAPRCQWHYELGYSVADDEWTLMIRTASYDGPPGRGSAEFSNVMPLRDAPLEIRLKAIREIPDLIQVLDSSIAVGFDCSAMAPALEADVAQMEEVMHQAAS